MKEEKKIIGVQISLELYKHLKALAGDSSISVSDTVRMILIDYLKRNGNNKIDLNIIPSIEEDN